MHLRRVVCTSWSRVYIPRTRTRACLGCCFGVPIRAPLEQPRARPWRQWSSNWVRSRARYLSLSLSLSLFLLLSLGCGRPLLALPLPWNDNDVCACVHVWVRPWMSGAQGAPGLNVEMACPRVTCPAVGHRVVIPLGFGDSVDLCVQRAAFYHHPYLVTPFHPLPPPPPPSPRLPPPSIDTGSLCAVCWGGGGGQAIREYREHIVM